MNKPAEHAHALPDTVWLTKDDKIALIDQTLLPAQYCSKNAEKSAHAAVCLFAL